MEHITSFHLRQAQKAIRNAQLVLLRTKITEQEKLTELGNILNGIDVPHRTFDESPWPVLTILSVMLLGGSAIIVSLIMLAKASISALAG